MGKLNSKLGIKMTQESTQFTSAQIFSVSKETGFIPRENSSTPFSLNVTKFAFVAVVRNLSSVVYNVLITRLKLGVDKQDFLMDQLRIRFK